VERSLEQCLLNFDCLWTEHSVELSGAGVFCTFCPEGCMKNAEDDAADLGISVSQIGKKCKCTKNMNKYVVLAAWTESLVWRVGAISHR
jgi:hypothetical protein